MLSVRNGIAAVDFYKAAFGAVELYRVDDGDGSVVAQLSVGSADFWVADESTPHLNFSPEIGGGSVRLILTVPDPDAAFARALAAGASQVTPVTDDYGWRVGRLVDPFGHHCEFGRPLTASH
jgi:PhnB protein